MALMLAKTYAAFRAAGVGEAEAQAAAEELAGYDSRLTGIETRLTVLDTKVDALDAKIDALDAKVNTGFSNVDRRFQLLTWALGLNMALTVIILSLLLRH